MVGTQAPIPAEVNKLPSQRTRALIITLWQNLRARSLSTLQRKLCSIWEILLKAGLILTIVVPSHALAFITFSSICLIHSLLEAQAPLCLPISGSALTIKSLPLYKSSPNALRWQVGMDGCALTSIWEFFCLSHRTSTEWTDLLSHFSSPMRQQTSAIAWMPTWINAGTVPTPASSESSDSHRWCTSVTITRFNTQAHLRRSKDSLLSVTLSQKVACSQLLTLMPELSSYTTSSKIQSSPPDGTTISKIGPSLQALDAVSIGISAWRTRLSSGWSLVAPF